jgi:hypothetical protein
MITEDGEEIVPVYEWGVRIGINGGFIKLGEVALEAGYEEYINDTNFLKDLMLHTANLVKESLVPTVRLIVDEGEEYYD